MRLTGCDAEGFRPKHAAEIAMVHIVPHHPLISDSTIIFSDARYRQGHYFIPRKYTQLTDTPQPIS